MNSKRIILGLCALAISTVAAAQSQFIRREAGGKLSALGWNFTAPALSDPTTISPHTIGDIVYDSSTTPGVFKGWNGVGYTSFGATSMPTLSVSSKTANYTVTTNDDVILANSDSGAFTLSLPTASGNTGKVFYVKKTGSGFTNAVTIAGSGGTQTIDGTTTYLLYTPNESLSFVSDGSNWNVLEHFTNTGWIDAGTTTITAVTTNPGKGNVLTDSVQWRRVGKFAEIKYRYNHGTTAGTAGSGDYLLGLPLTVDTSVVPAHTTAGITSIQSLAYPSHLKTTGFMTLSNGTAHMEPVVAVLYSSTQVRVAGQYSSGSQRNWDSTYIALNSQNIGFALDIEVPVSGWRE